MTVIYTIKKKPSTTMPTKQCSTIDNRQYNNRQYKTGSNKRQQGHYKKTSNKQLKASQGKPEEGKNLSNQTNNYSSQ